MTIKDILKQVALLMGRDDIVNFINTPNTETPDFTLISEVEKLISLTNMAIQEFAITYVPMHKEETKQVTNGKVLYSALSQRAVKIRAVNDLNDNSIPFVSTPTYMEVDGDSVKIDYEFMPPTYMYNSTVDYDESEVPSYILALEVISEYCLSLNWFSEATMWHDRYIQEARKLVGVYNTTVKQRSWV